MHVALEMERLFPASSDEETREQPGPSYSEASYEIKGSKGYKPLDARSAGRIKVRPDKNLVRCLIGIVARRKTAKFFFYFSPRGISCCFSGSAYGQLATDKDAESLLCKVVVVGQYLDQ